MMMNRRSFVGAGSLALLAAGCRSIWSSAPDAEPAKRRPQGLYTFGRVPFKFGCAGFTFHKFNADRTLQILQELDIHYLCLKDFHLPIKSTQAEIDAFKRKCADHGVIGYGVGPIYMDAAKPDFVTEAFEYAARIGVSTIVGVPFEMRVPEGETKPQRCESRALCERISGLCDAYKINYAIHNHGPDIPYLFPNAESAIAQIHDLSPRMGLCLDIGHQWRDGKDPVAAIRRFHARLFDMHVKNVDWDPKKNLARPMPRGEMDLAAVVRALCEVGYAGCCSLEFEHFPMVGEGKDRKLDETLFLQEVRESVGYFRGLMDSARG